VLKGRDEICMPQGCDQHIEVRDEDGGLIRREPCDDCPLLKMDQAVNENSVLTRAFDLDFALTCGLHLTMSDLTVEEFRTLKAIRAEKNKVQIDLHNQSQTSR
jgi:hypothetical protein